MKNFLQSVGATCGRPPIHSKQKRANTVRPYGTILNSILIAAVSCYMLVNFLGGSKPPPYHVVVCTVSLATAFGCLSLTVQLLLFRKNNARLACSVVNALTTAHCRYQLLRIADNRKGCPYSALHTPQRFYHRFIGQACFLNAARNST